MILLHQITPDLVDPFRTVRLRALRDCPVAFAATYATESRLTQKEWLDRSRRWASATSVGYLAEDDGFFCGIVAAYHNASQASRVHLAATWVDPMYRCQGVGRTLLTAATAWACAHKACDLQLMVTSTNNKAIRFYERSGFLKTGIRVPYPNDPSLSQEEMMRLLILIPPH